MPNRGCHHLGRPSRSRGAWSPAARKIAGQLAVVVVAVLVLVLLARALGGIDFGEVAAAIRRLPASTLAQAVGLTAISYCWLIGYDTLALRYLGKDLPWPRRIFTSLAAFALQRNVGPAPLTGGALRYRYYRGCGLSAGEAVLVTLLCGLCFTLGIVFTGGLALLIEPGELATLVKLPEWPLRLGGAALLLGLGGFLYWTAFRHHPLRLRGRTLPAPSIRISLGQLFFGVVDLGLVAGVVYVLLPASVELSYPAFLGLYVLALVAGALSHVPGGVGVFESVLLLLLPGESNNVVLASLLAFRGVYYLLPLLVMGTVVGLYELSIRLRRAASGT